ncbi:MAG: hypothetical protein ACODAE_04730 [Gemmatimonadota bacterium]
MASSDESEPDLLDALERRARESVPAGDSPGGEETTPDLVDALRDAAGEAAGAGDPPDLTVIGYIAHHDRPPAFTGGDDQPYTVDVDVEETGEPIRPYAAYFVFVRWAQTGAGIMGHVESEDVAYGETEEEAKRAALEISLYEVKAELDAAIERRRRLVEED